MDNETKIWLLNIVIRNGLSGFRIVKIINNFLRTSFSLSFQDIEQFMFALYSESQKRACTLYKYELRLISIYVYFLPVICILIQFISFVQHMCKSY